MSNDLTLHRILKAPRALVWRCWTEPELMKHWFCPKPHFVTEAKVDLRAGGQFFTVMNVNGDLYPSDGSFLEVVPQERLVFTDLLLSDWRPVDAPGLGFTAIITLKDHPQGTEYTALARHRTPEQARKHEEMGFSQGWGIAAEQLEAAALALAATDDPRDMLLSRVIRATPEAIWNAWTDPEVLPRWFGPEGHSCRTIEIDLRQGGFWRFDMIGPDGTVYPNRHRFRLFDRPRRIEFDLDDGTGHSVKHAFVTLTPVAGGTQVELRMRFPDAESRQQAAEFGAIRLGLTTLGKLAAIAEAA